MYSNGCWVCSWKLQSKLRKAQTRDINSGRDRTFDVIFPFVFQHNEVGDVLSVYNFVFLGFNVEFKRIRCFTQPQTLVLSSAVRLMHEKLLLFQKTDEQNL